MSFEFNPFTGNFDKVTDIVGKINQIDVVKNGDTYNLTTPQDIHTGATPQFQDVQVLGSGLGNRFIGKTLAQLSSTGVIEGLNLSVNVTPSTFDVAAGRYEIVDNYTDPENPVVTPISYAGSTGNAVTNLATSDITYILLDNLGTIYQQTTFPTPDDRRGRAFIGRLNHTNRTSISFADTFPDIKNGIVSQFFDLCDSMGPFKITGLEIATVSNNLTFQRSSGSAFFRSSNYATDLKNPHTSSYSASNPQAFRKMTQSVFTDVTNVTVVEPNYYDVAGVRTLNSGGNGTATIQRVFLYKSGLVGVAYGQTVYNNLATALSNISSDPFIPNPSTQQTAILIGYIVLTKDCNNLQDANKARVLTSSKFGTSAGAVTGGVTSLQQAYNNSTLPQIILSALQGAFTIDDASTPIGTLLDVRNNAGTSSFLRVDADGVHTTNFEGAGTSGAVRFHNLTTTQRDALTPQNGMMIYNTTESQYEVYFGAKWQTLVTNENSVVITNKDIDGGTASNTSRLTTPRSATIEAAAALVRKKATLLYNDFTNKFLKDNGTDLKSIPDFGDVNIFAQEIAADNVIGSWTQNLSGITATFTKGTDSRLGTCYKLDITSASSGAGGTYTVRKDFAVPEAFRGTFVELSYDYVSTVSKTGTCVILYDVTNSVAIVPQTDIQAQPDPTSLVTKGFITFSIPSTCENLRVFIGRSADASAIAISNQYFYFNNLQFKKFTQAIAITEGPKSMVRFTGGNTRGSTDSSVLYFPTLAEQYGTGFTAATDSTLGTRVTMLRAGILDISLTLNRPVASGTVLVTKNSISATAPEANQVTGLLQTSAGGFVYGISGKTRVQVGDVIRITSATNNSSNVPQNTLSLILHEDNLAARYADYTLNQDVVFQGYVATNQSLTANVTNIVLATNKDTTNSWDGDEFIVPSSGDYIISGFLSTNSNSYKKIDLYVDGIFVSAVGENSGFSTVQINSGVLSFQRGERLSFRSSISLSTTNVSGYYFTIQKVATSQQLFTPIAQRYVVRSGFDNTTGFEWVVNNDGWVELSAANKDFGSGTASLKTVNFPFNFKDLQYSALQSIVTTYTGAANLEYHTFKNKTVSSVQITSDTNSRYRDILIKGYGDSAAVKARGANPSY